MIRASAVVNGQSIFAVPPFRPRSHISVFSTRWRCSPKPSMRGRIRVASARGDVSLVWVRTGGQRARKHQMTQPTFDDKESTAPASHGIGWCRSERANNRIVPLRNRVSPACSETMNAGLGLVLPFAPERALQLVAERQSPSQRMVGCMVVLAITTMASQTTRGTLGQVRTRLRSCMSGSGECANASPGHSVDGSQNPK